MPDRPSFPADDSLRALATAAAAGDERAFEALYTRLAGGVRRFLAKRCGPRPELIEELTQRAWVELWRAMHERRYDPARSAVSTYLYALSFKLWIKYGRETRGVALDDETLEAALQAGGQESLDDAAHAAELLEALRSCLTADKGPFALTAAERRIVQAAAAGVGERALAGELGLAPSTVHGHKQRGLEKIRKCLTHKGFTSTGGERGEAADE